MLRGSLVTLWKVVAGGLVFGISLVASRLAFQLAGFSPPRAPAQAPETVAGWYLLAGSLALAAATLMPARGIWGAPLARSLAYAWALVSLLARRGKL